MAKLLIWLLMSAYVLCEEEACTQEDQESLFADPRDQLDLDYDTAVELVALPLECITVEYPNKLSQLLQNESELLPPSVLHPTFYGCYDWHSAVHGHWLMAKVGNLFPDTEIFTNISTALASQITPEKVEVELAYFQRPAAKNFERTYGWAWLLKLQTELQSSEVNEFQKLGELLKPLAEFIEDLYVDFLPRLAYPVRVGTHSNTAFGLVFAQEYALLAGNAKLQESIRNVSRTFYTEDVSCPLGYEPSGYDFLSPCLQEAELMSRILVEEEEFVAWLENFLPQLFDETFVLVPGEVIDRTDGHLVHLDGLNFSRAWALYTIAFRTQSPMRERLMKMGDDHILTSIDQVVESHYVGSHWLASFLFHALETRHMGQ